MRSAVRAASSPPRPETGLFIPSAFVNMAFLGRLYCTRSLELSASKMTMSPDGKEDKLVVTSKLKGRISPPWPKSNDASIVPNNDQEASIGFLRGSGRCGCSLLLRRDFFGMGDEIGEERITVQRIKVWVFFHRQVARSIQPVVDSLTQ
jgi:hypothetical protein